MKVLKKERQNLEDAAALLLSTATKAGATRAEVCGSFSQRNKILLEKQDFHLASADHGYDLGLRVKIGHKQGFASCNTTNAAELKEIANRAVEIANLSPENPYNVVVETPNIPKEAPDEPWDDHIHSLSLQSQKDWAKALITESTRDPRMRVNDGSVEVGSSLVLVANTRGTHKVERDATATWGLMGMGVDGDNITSFDYFQEIARKAAHVPDRLVGSINNFCKDVLANLDHGKAQSYRGLVVFTPRAVMDILIGSLTHHANGRSVVEKMSKWSNDTVGQPVVNEMITLSDKPWLTDRMGWSTFDREGHPTQNLTFIEKGVLKSLLLDQYAAQALGLASTGHAGGGPTSLPSVSTHSLVLHGGGEGLDELLKRTGDQQKEYLVVHRFSGQTDPITGDFSGVAKGAEWFKGTERCYSVQETSISGNLFETLGSQLFGISRETEVIQGYAESPHLVSDGVSVTAN